VQAYKEINTFVALTGFEVWTDGDKITVSSAPGTTLGSFSSWRNSDLIKRKKHDNAQLLRSAPITMCENTNIQLRTSPILSLLQSASLSSLLHGLA